MDGSPIEVVSAEFARRLEMDRARLMTELRKAKDMLQAVAGDLEDGIPRDMQGKLCLCVLNAADRASVVLSELERNEK
jgi:hypothetical protein